MESKLSTLWINILICSQLYTGRFLWESYQYRSELLNIPILHTCIPHSIFRAYTYQSAYSDPHMHKWGYDIYHESIINFVGGLK